jgi:hypothetical protein
MSSWPLLVMTVALALASNAALAAHKRWRHRRPKG